mmetsp:Transcript_6817/g.13974  ORF Transcript_6817/g.13974 Transcript_6817/m.13974 type:complete len:422 (-) Transcript_6817:525-1790(-)
MQIRNDGNQNIQKNDQHQQEENTKKDHRQLIPSKDRIVNLSQHHGISPINRYPHGSAERIVQVWFAVVDDLIIIEIIVVGDVSSSSGSGIVRCSSVDSGDVIRIGVVLRRIDRHLLCQSGVCALGTLAEDRIPHLGKCQYRNQQTNHEGKQSLGDVDHSADEHREIDENALQIGQDLIPADAEGEGSPGAEAFVVPQPGLHEYGVVNGEKDEGEVEHILRVEDVGQHGGLASHRDHLRDFPKQKVERPDVERAEQRPRHGPVGVGRIEFVESPFDAFETGERKRPDGGRQEVEVQHQNHGGEPRTDLGIQRRLHRRVDDRHVPQPLGHFLNSRQELDGGFGIGLQINIEAFLNGVPLLQLALVHRRRLGRQQMQGQVILRVHRVHGPGTLLDEHLHQTGRIGAIGVPHGEMQGRPSLPVRF